MGGQMREWRDGMWGVTQVTCSSTISCSFSPMFDVRSLSAVCILSCDTRKSFSASAASSSRASASPVLSSPSPSPSAPPPALSRRRRSPTPPPALRAAASATDASNSRPE